MIEPSKLCEFCNNNIDLVEYDKQIREDVIEEVKDGLKALKDKGYSTYYIDDELIYLEQLKELNK